MKRYKDEDIRNAFGQALREKRQELGMTQEELAQKANLKRDAIHLYEEGLKEPWLSTVLKISKAFGKPPSSWIGRMDEILNPKK